MDPSRRGLLAGALGAGGVAIAQSAVGPLHAAEPAPPSPATPTDPVSYSLDLLGQPDSVNIDGSWLREASFRNFTASTGISGGVISLAPGALRQLHWHAHANEWAYVIAGRCRVTIIDPEGRYQTVDFAAGDTWYFPRGFGHAIQCIGAEECLFVLAFDNGMQAEFATFSLSDWVSTIPDAVLGQTFDVPPATFAGFHDKPAFFIKAASPPPLPAEPPPGSLGEGSFNCRYRLAAQRPTFTLRGGTVRLASSREFPLSSGMTAALIHLDPGALREPHWHPDANEWQYVVSGKARTTIYLSHGRSVALDLDSGYVAYVPRGCGHFIESVGTEPLEFLSVFDSGIYQSIDLRGWVRSNTAELVATDLRQPVEVVRTLTD
jgi:oxalate decarboxylase